MRNPEIKVWDLMLIGEIEKKLTEVALYLLKKDKTYLVGGVVRDYIVRKQIKDIDIVTELSVKHLLKEVDRKFNIKYTKYNSFFMTGVIKNGIRIDLARSRKEFYSHPGALPTIEPAPLKEDFFRRDFTINAIAFSFLKGIIDPYNGVSDLKAGLLRVLHKNSFLDDPTRLLRGLRFKYRFNFAFEPYTLKLWNIGLDRRFLSYVSPQRIKRELFLVSREDEKGKIAIELVEKGFVSHDFLRYVSFNLEHEVFFMYLLFFWHSKNFPFSKKEDAIIRFIKASEKNELSLDVLEKVDRDFIYKWIKYPFEGREKVKRFIALNIKHTLKDLKEKGLLKKANTVMKRLKKAYIEGEIEDFKGEALIIKKEFLC